MTRTDLAVPFNEKDQAKRLGAGWDREMKVWYVPAGVDPAPFERWFLPKEEVLDVSAQTVRAGSYFIASTVTKCWKCSDPTRVFGFVLPAGFETLEPVDEEDAGFGESDSFDEKDYQAWLDSPSSSAWYAHEEDRSPVWSISHLSPTAAARMNEITRNYRSDYSATARCWYMMNHCEACGTKQGDYALFNTMGTAFSPVDEASLARITLLQVNEPFACNGATYESGSDLYNLIEPLDFDANKGEFSHE